MDFFTQVSNLILQSTSFLYQSFLRLQSAEDLSGVIPFMCLFSIPRKVRPQIIAVNYRFVATELATKIIIFPLHFRYTEFSTDRFILREFLCNRRQLRFEIGNGAFQFRDRKSVV